MTLAGTAWYNGSTIAISPNPGTVGHWVPTNQGNITGLTFTPREHNQEEVGMGDFLVQCRITLDQLGGTAASLELGVDRFGFDGRQGYLFCEGDTFGPAQFFAPTHKFIREGESFFCTVERKSSQITFSINGHLVATIADDPSRKVGLVGLRPLRNGISIHSFQVAGREVALKSVDLA